MNQKNDSIRRHTILAGAGALLLGVIALVFAWYTDDSFESSLTPEQRAHAQKVLSWSKVTELNDGVQATEQQWVTTAELADTLIGYRILDVDGTERILSTDPNSDVKYASPTIYPRYFVEADGRVIYCSAMKLGIGQTLLAVHVEGDGLYAKTKWQTKALFRPDISDFPPPWWSKGTP